MYFWHCPTPNAALLLCSIMEEHKTSPTAPVIHMVKAAKVLAQHLSVNDRIAVANAFRDAADQVENRHRRVAVN